MNNTKKGFTLVELLVVIAILAILATVSVVGYTSFINRAHESNAATLLAQVVDYIYSEEVSTDPYTVDVEDDDELHAYLTDMGVDADEIAKFSIGADGKTVTYAYDSEDANKKVTAVIGQ